MARLSAFVRVIAPVVLAGLAVAACAPGGQPRQSGGSPQAARSAAAAPAVPSHSAADQASQHAPAPGASKLPAGSGYAPSPGASAPAPSPAAPPAPPRVLTVGMSGPDVRQLQQRLAALDYYPGPADGQFGQDTLEALWAFQAVQGMPVTGQVGAPTRQALASPRSPAVLVPGGGSLRVEVNLSDEVLVLYRGGRVALISHVSSGGGYYFCNPGGGCAYAITPTGDFTTTTFMPGWVTVPLGQMYNPVFFIATTFAIHGDTYVPLQPASHGCVRIPMDIAQFFHTLVPAPGTPVYVRR